MPPRTIQQRKSAMTALQHRVCDEVKRLRSDLGLSIVLFARQIGVTERTLTRWEAHDYAPTRRHILRLKQLRDMQEHLDSRDRGDVAISFGKGEWVKTARRKDFDARRFHTLWIGFAGALLEALGGEAQIRIETVERFRKRKPLCCFNPATKRYELALRRRKTAAGGQETAHETLQRA